MAQSGIVPSGGEGDEKTSIDIAFALPNGDVIKRGHKFFDLIKNSFDEMMQEDLMKRIFGNMGLLDDE